MRKGEVIGCVHLFALKKPTSFLGLSVCLLAPKNPASSLGLSGCGTKKKMPDLQVQTVLLVLNTFKLCETLKNCHVYAPFLLDTLVL